MSYFTYDVVDDRCGQCRTISELVNFNETFKASKKECKKDMDRSDRKVSHHLHCTVECADAVDDRK